MTLNLELLAVSLTLALTIGGVVWASVLIDERRDRSRRAVERAHRSGATGQKG
jgi:hypothetical protein